MKPNQYQDQEWAKTDEIVEREKMDLVFLIFLNHLFAQFKNTELMRCTFFSQVFLSLQLYHGLPPHQNVTSLEIEKWELVGSLIRVWTHWKFSAGFQLPNHNAPGVDRPETAVWKYSQSKRRSQK